MNTETTATLNTEATTAPTIEEGKRLEKFHFKAVKVEDSKYAGTLAALDKFGCAYTKTVVGEKPAILRTAIEVQLPVFSILELAEANEAFVQDMVAKMVTTTARKMYIDQYQDVGAITIADIITHNTAQGRSSVSTELLATFIDFIKRVMTGKEVNGGTISTVQELVKGKFNTNVLNKYAKMSEQFTTILEKLVGYVEEFADDEGQAQLAPVLDLLATNLTRYQAAAATEEDELDFGAL